MKKLFVFLLGVILSVPLLSQDLSVVDSTKKEFKVNTLFSHKNKRDIQLGYFMEMNAGYTQIGDKNVFLPGMNIGLILNHNWSVGLSGSFIGNSGNMYFENIYYSSNIPDLQTGAYLFGGYGGGLFEYTAFPRSVVHFSIPVMIGGGYFAYFDDIPNAHSDYNSWDYSTIDWNVCFVIEPGIKAEFNILKMLRLGIGVSYRYSPNFELVNTPDDLLNQFTGRFSLRFGKF